MNEQPDSATELRARALRLLARREHSRAELERKLGPHAASPEIIGGILDTLAQKKQLSDVRYAEERARSLSRKYGVARIRHELKAKGVDKETIDKISSEGELERARAILARKYREPAATREERATRMRFLQGRGFSYDVIRQALAANTD
ncbi:MAG: recombination regulator RecX [Planctomycetota bacterium]